jgi:hypothetical protein
MKKCVKCQKPGNFTQSRRSGVLRDGSVKYYSTERLICNECLYARRKEIKWADVLNPTPL